MPTWSRQTEVVRRIQPFQIIVTEAVGSPVVTFRVDETAQSVGPDGILRYRWTVQTVVDGQSRTIGSSETAYSASEIQPAQVIRLVREMLELYYRVTLGTWTPA